MIAIGLVLIAAIAAGTVIGVNLSADKQKNSQTPMVFSLTQENHETTISLKKADMINLTLPDYGDGGYIWTILQCDENILHQTDSFQWDSSGMLGDFGKDSWLFTAINPGNTLLELRCQRSFGEQDICQTFIVTITVV